MENQGTIVVCLNCGLCFIDTNLTFHNPNVTSIEIKNCDFCDPAGKNSREIFVYYRKKIKPMMKYKNNFSLKN